MTGEELEREAVRKSLSYNTKYAEDGDLNDMLSRPQDFIEGSIAGMVDFLRKKAYRDGMVDGAEPREKQIEDLEKENAELKDDNKVMADNYSKMEQKFYNNLSKATKLLNEFMRISKASDEDFEHDYSELIGEAEQFIKGVEK